MNSKKTAKKSVKKAAKKGAKAKIKHKDTLFRHGQILPRPKRDSATGVHRPIQRRRRYAGNEDTEII